MVARAAVRLEGPDGYWTSTARAVIRPEGTTFAMDIYVGGGGYEGLHAILDCGTTTGPDCGGHVIEDEMPPLPSVTPAASPSPGP